MQFFLTQTTDSITGDHHFLRETTSLLYVPCLHPSSGECALMWKLVQLERTGRSMCMRSYKRRDITIARLDAMLFFFKPRYLCTLLDLSQEIWYRNLIVTCHRLWIIYRVAYGHYNKMKRYWNGATLLPFKFIFGRIFTIITWIYNIVWSFYSTW